MRNSWRKVTTCSIQKSCRLRKSTKARTPFWIAVKRLCFRACADRRQTNCISNTSFVLIFCLIPLSLTRLSRRPSSSSRRLRLPSTSSTRRLRTILHYPITTAPAHSSVITHIGTAGRAQIPFSKPPTAPPSPAPTTLASRPRRAKRRVKTCQETASSLVVPGRALSSGGGNAPKQSLQVTSNGRLLRNSSTTRRAFRSQAACVCRRCGVRTFGESLRRRRVQACTLACGNFGSWWARKVRFESSESKKEAGCVTVVLSPCAQNS